jgi:hypothetical protein
MGGCGRPAGLTGGAVGVVVVGSGSCGPSGGRRIWSAIVVVAGCLCGFFCGGGRRVARCAARAATGISCASPLCLS